ERERRRGSSAVRQDQLRLEGPGLDEDRNGELADAGSPRKRRNERAVVRDLIVDDSVRPEGPGSAHALDGRVAGRKAGGSQRIRDAELVPAVGRKGKRLTRGQVVRAPVLSRRECDLERDGIRPHVVDGEIGAVGRVRPEAVDLYRRRWSRGDVVVGEAGAADWLWSHGIGSGANRRVDPGRVRGEQKRA